MKKILLCLASMACLLATPVLAKHHDCSCPHHTKDTVKTVYKLGNLSVSDAFIRPTTSVNTSSAAYVTINNTGTTDDKLIKIESDIASNVTIHDTKIDDKGIMSMTLVTEGVLIPAQKSVTLKPRGLHIMLVNVSETLTKGASIPLKLVFEKSGTRMISFTVADDLNPHQCKH